MTVSSLISKIIYAANSATTMFTFPFAIDSTTDIQVFITDATGAVTQVTPGLFSVSINVPIAPNPTSVGGFITYPQSGAPLATGNTLTIARVLPVTQTTSLANQGVLYPTVIESEFDDSIMIDQQIYELIGRQFTVPISDPNPATVPSVALRANLWAAFDSAGNMIGALSPGTVAISGAMIPVVQAGSIAAAQVLLGIPTGAAVAPGIEAPYAGLIVPSGWYLETGAAIARATDAPLLAAIAPTYTGLTITNGLASVSGFSSTEGFYSGMPIESSFFAAATTVLSISGPTVAVMSSNATGGGAVLQCFPHGNGNGSTTFNLPDGRGNAYFGRDDMGGTPAGRLTSPSFPKSTGVGVAGGLQTHTQTAGEMPNHQHAGTTGDDAPDHTHSLPMALGASGGAAGGSFNVYAAGGGNATGGASPKHQHPFTTSLVGGGAAMPIIPPGQIRNWIIKR